ncbi:MAG: TIGR02922 family protein [Thalassotalea sp.]|nr:TIGR02922 family protein [Thalassotalea sp.]
MSYNFDHVLEQSIQEKTREVTIFYTGDNSIGIKRFVGRFIVSDSGRVIIPAAFKKGKSIMVICDGRVKVLNTYGDRLGVEHETEYCTLTKLTP